MIRFFVKIKMPHVFLAAAVVLVKGCTFSAPQFDSAIKFVHSLRPIRADSPEGEPAVWLALVGEHGAVLTPYTSGGFIVFANADGDAIAFDGWTVRSVSGFGLATPISVSGREGVRKFSGELGRFSTVCDPWVLENYRWFQSCGNGQGFIELNEAGNIVRISIPLSKNNGNVSLWVAK